MHVKDLIGEYNILGTNQNEENSAYSGVLRLGLDENQKILAQWNICGDQVQRGTGFFKDNILVINFQYEGGDEIVYKGVVVYRCIDRNQLDGFWSEKHGNQSTIGTEKCTRINRLDEFSDN